MAQQEDAYVYNINKDYRIVGLRGNRCSLFFKNSQNQLIATVEGCQNIFTNIAMNKDRTALNMIEKKYLSSFIRAKKYMISKEVAEMLDVSIIKYLDGTEEYLSERQIKNRIANGIDFAKIYIGRLTASSLKIPAYSKESTYHLGNAEISKLIVDENCSINIDCRDNQSIESISIGENFAGTVNLSRTGIESIFIRNNSRCNLTIADSKKCFNLQIADIYSGNLNISNSCLYAFSVGYYSYADIMLTNNIIKKEISVGDSFRGSLYAANQSVDVLKVGTDCKGWLKISSQGRDMGIKKIMIDDDFAGTLSLSSDESVSSLEFGRKNSGKTEASYTALQNIKLGKFFNGTMDLKSSAVQNISVAYGASGKIDISGCENLMFIQSTVDNNLILDGNMSITETKNVNGTTYYNFNHKVDINKLMPFYKKLYQNTKKMLLHKMN